MRAVERLAEENLRQAATHYPRRMEKEAQLRRQCRDLNAPSADDIALLKNNLQGLAGRRP